MRISDFKLSFEGCILCYLVFGGVFFGNPFLY
nr:MAG TPA: hypothetical protein [Bacteriophage sp.]